MKKGILFLLILMLTSVFVPINWAEAAQTAEPFYIPVEEIKVVGTEIVNIPPALILVEEENKLLLPIRAVGEYLEWDVQWDVEQQKVILTNREETMIHNDRQETIILTIGQKEAVIKYGSSFDGKVDEQEEKIVFLPIEPIIYDDIAMVPMEIIEKGFSSYVDYSVERVSIYLIQSLGAP